MGQARKRGGLEDRVQQSLERQRREREGKIAAEIARKERLKREGEEWWNSLTKEQQEAELAEYRAKKKRRREVMGVVGFGFALGASYFG